MKSTRITYICSFLFGIVLFSLGIYFLVNINISNSQPKDTSNPSSDSKSFSIIDNYTDNGNPMNFLVLIKEASGDNTDSIIIANYDPSTKQISLLTVPRDTQRNDENLKINSVFYLGKEKAYRSDKSLSESELKHKGAEYTAQKISNLTNIPIDYYIYLEIDTIKEIVDRLDGIYFDVPAKLHKTDPSQNLYIDLEKGYQLLNGDKAEQLLRFRKGQGPDHEWQKYYDGSDLKRTEMQVKFLNEIIKQKVNLLELPNLINIINYTFNNIITNTSLNDTLSLLSAFTNSSKPSMNTFRLFGDDKGDLYIYNKKVVDTKTNKTFNSQEIIDEYFKSSSVLFVPDKTKLYDYNSVANKNPSNAETDTHRDNTDKP